MPAEINKIEALSKKLDELLSMHNAVSNEIDSLRVEIIRLKVEQKKQTTGSLRDEQPSVDPTPVQPKVDVETVPFDPLDESIQVSDTVDLSHSKDTDTKDQIIPPLSPKGQDYFETKKQRSINRESYVKENEKSYDIEKLIGENLINKIGILVLIIGVAIGAKYSFENDLISPLGRIILGYAVGILLLVLGMWLKQKYLNFSAVLVSGAMAIFYFITFFAYSFYLLIGQEVAFGLMVLFTIFTVLAALNYDKQIIAHLGLVGAVSVPFLLSNESGNALFLFSYIALINFGIAFISLKKHWKLLFYSSFVLTWLVYFTWIVLGYEESQHFSLALSFLTLYFILFYVIFIAYKFLNLKKYNVGDVSVLIINALIFFGIGYGLLENHEIGSQVLGIFSVANAFIHFVAATIINRRKLADRNLFYLIVGLVLVCLTLAIPIQLDGHWVTIMWSGEALVLFLIGRSKQVSFYEYIAYLLVLIAGVSLVQDWDYGYTTFLQDVMNQDMRIFVNTIFLTSVIASICLGAIYWIHRNKEWRAASKIDKHFLQMLDYILPIALAVVVYFAIRLELMQSFTQWYTGTAFGAEPDMNTNLRKYNISIRHQSNIWLLNYTLLYLSGISLLVYNKTKSIPASWAMIYINAIAVLGFMGYGLYELSELRENYINQPLSEYFNADNSFMWLRYLSIACLSFLIGATHLLLKRTNKDYKIYAVAETLFFLIVLWLTTSELIHWLDLTERSKTYGLALSIYWGIYSVFIIAFGIWKKKKHLRILGIVIFAVTLIKLFFYDLSHLKPIAKTIVMISLGALLLLTSFLYNKYKIDDEEGT